MILNIGILYFSKLSLRDPGVPLEMAVLQRGLWHQAAVQAPLVNPQRVVQAVWSQAVAVCLLLKGSNLVLN